MNAHSRLGVGVACSIVFSSALALAEEPTSEASVAYAARHDLVTGAYGAPQVKMSTLAGDAALLAGGEGGLILADSLMLGGAGYGSVTSVVAPRSLQSSSGDARLGMAYGGVRLAGIVASQRRLHGAFGLLLGAGSAWSENRNLGFHRSDGFIVIEPHLEAELNVTHHLRVALGGGYRLIGGTDSPEFPARRLAGPVATATLRLGEF